MRLEALDIGAWARTDGQKLSGGVKRLVSFVMAAVVPGRVVMLDEPTNDVDPVRRRLLWAQVSALADEGAAVLLVTHNVVEAERAVDRLAILDHGRVVAEGTPASLRSALGGGLRLELALESGAATPPCPAFADRYARWLARADRPGAGEGRRSRGVGRVGARCAPGGGVRAHGRDPRGRLRGPRGRPGPPGP